MSIQEFIRGLALSVGELVPGVGGLDLKSARTAEQFVHGPRGIQAFQHTGVFVQPN